MLLKNYSATFYPKVARFRIKNSLLFKAKSHVFMPFSV